MPLIGSFAGASARAFGASAGVVVGDFESIATVTVGTATPTVEFTGIPATYTHLQIRASLQTARTNAPLDKVFWRFNSDTASNYSSHAVWGNGASATSAVENTTAISGFDNFSTNTGNSSEVYGVLIMDILDYANTNKYKTIRALSGFDVNGTIAGFGGRVGLTSGNWRSTSAITSITFTVDNAANYSANSKFSLYGVKA
jgi:hypothetical protein